MREVGRGLAEIGAGIAIAGAVFSMAQCQIAQDKTNVEELKVCLDHGGYLNNAGICVIKGRNDR